MNLAKDIQARPLPLIDLLDGIADGTVVLPDFQRDFVWSEGDVIALIATVMVGWPAGSLLLMQGAPTFFTTREFLGAPPKKPDVTFVVLDGQQRLTALFRAFRRAGGSIYAVKLDALTAGKPSAEALEEALVRYSVSDWDAKVPIAEQARLRLVPLYALSSASDYFQWRDRAVDAAAPALQSALSEDLATAYKDFLGTVNHYDFPAVVLNNELPTEAVARIFERINRGGQALSTFDLLVARSYTQQWNLRDEWAGVRAESTLINAYLKDDGLPVVQSLALKTVGDIRRPALLELDRALIEDDWDSTVEATERALEFLVAAGMRHPDWLPYSSLVIPLAALARDHSLEDAREQLEAWLWGRSFAGDYDVASSTKISSDYKELKRAINSGNTIVFRVPPNRILGATRRSGGSLWRAFLSLMLRGHALDLFDGAVIAPTPVEAIEATALSLYAKTVDRAEDAPHLRLASHVLVRRGHRRGAASSVLAEILDGSRSDGDIDQRLVSQFLPVIADLAAMAPDAERLLRFRSEAAMDWLFDELTLLEPEPENQPH